MGRWEVKNEQRQPDDLMCVSSGRRFYIEDKYSFNLGESQVELNMYSLSEKVEESLFERNSTMVSGHVPFLS